MTDQQVRPTSSASESADDGHRPLPFGSLRLRGARALLIASTGGHAAQLVTIAAATGVDASSVFVTFAGVQADDIATKFRVVHVPYVRPRGYRTALALARRFHALLGQEQFDIAVSTGSAVAFPGLVTARARGLRAVYVESYTRYQHPSLSGRVLRRSPGVEVYSQHPGWPAPWRHDGSVLDVLHPQPTLERAGGPARRVFVTLGTIRPYRFDALVDAVLALLPEGVEVTWQLGATTRDDLPGRVTTVMTTGEFEDAIRDADVVVSHGGTGTILQLLTMGAHPILVPRRATRGEHVDDHQIDVCLDWSSRGIARLREADQLTAADFGWPDVGSAGIGSADFGAGA